MESKFYPVNQSILEFSKRASEKLEIICAPLFKGFPVTNFGYVRIDEKGSILRLSTDHQWSKKYFKYKFYNDINFYEMNDIAEGEIKKTAISGIPSGEHYSALYNHNIWNLYVIYERYTTYGNVWFFGSKKENDQAMNFYMNKEEILRKFILYVKERAHDFITTSDTNVMIHSLVKPFSNPWKQVEDPTFEQMKTRKYYLEGRFSNIYLSKRESDVLLHLAQGKSTKEISKIFNLSPRTIESHLESVKNKTNVHTKNELIDMFIKNIHL